MSAICILGMQYTSGDSSKVRENNSFMTKLNKNKWYDLLPAIRTCAVTAAKATVTIKTTRDNFIFGDD